MRSYKDYPKEKKEHIHKLADELAEIVTKFSNFYGLDYYDLAVITQAVDLSVKEELKKEKTNVRNYCN